MEPAALEAVAPCAKVIMVITLPDTLAFPTVICANRAHTAVFLLLCVLSNRFFRPHYLHWEHLHLIRLDSHQSIIIKKSLGFKQYAE